MSQHPAAADMASVAAAVASHLGHARQAAEALAAALPATAAALAAADATALLPPDMQTEVGFLSAQLLGGEAAATATAERANALLAQLAAPVAALQSAQQSITQVGTT